MSASVRRELDLIRLCRLLDGVRWSSGPSHTCLSRLANAKIRSSPRTSQLIAKSGRLLHLKVANLWKAWARRWCIARRNVMKGLVVAWDGSGAVPEGSAQKIAKSTSARSREHPTFSTNARAYHSQIRKVIAARAVIATDCTPQYEL